MMNNKKLVGILDYEEGLSRLVGNAELYEDLIKCFIDENSMNDAIKAYEKKNYDELLSSVHDIKGVSGNLSMRSLFEISSKLVATIRRNDYSLVDAEFAELKEVFNTTIMMLKEALEG